MYSIQYCGSLQGEWLLRDFSEGKFKRIFGQVKSTEFFGDFRKLIFRLFKEFGKFQKKKKMGTGQFAAGWFVTTVLPQPFCRMAGLPRAGFPRKEIIGIIFPTIFNIKYTYLIIFYLSIIRTGWYTNWIDPDNGIDSIIDTAGESF